MLLPRIPDAWLDDDTGVDDTSAEPGEGNTNSAGVRANGLLAALDREPMPTSGLNLLMEPHEIASVPDLPKHVYGTPLDDGDHNTRPISFSDIGSPEKQVRVAESGFFHSPPAVGPRMESKLPPTYVPENGLDSFARALANGVTLNAADGIAAMGDATIPLDSGASKAPTWSQRAQENADAQYRTSVADREYHPVASAAGDIAAFVVNPGGVLFPSKSLIGSAVIGAVLGGSKQVGDNLRTRNPDITHDVLTKAAEGAVGRTGFYLYGNRNLNRK